MNPEPRVHILEARPGRPGQTLVLFEFLPSGGQIEIPVPISLLPNQPADEHPAVWRSIEDLLLLLHNYARLQRNLTSETPPSQAGFL